MPSIQSLVERPVSFVFRAAAIQFRSATTGQYTGNWVDISSYVKKWGTMELAVDDIRFNQFTDKGVTLTVNNDQGAFNHHSNLSSLWFGSLTRYRTLLRIQAGYYDTDLSSQYPTDPTLGVFVCDQEFGIQSDSNDVYLRASSLRSVFDEVVATDIGGIFNVTLTADAIIAKIRDYTDGAGVFVFRQFITSTAWSITAAPNNYVLTTDLANNFSAWDVMDTLAESEGYVVMMNRTGGVEFRQRGARQGSSQFSFYGQNFSRPNIIRITDSREAWDKYHNIFRMQYNGANVTAGTATTVDAISPSWNAGARTYDFQNDFPSDTATAQSLVNNLFSLSAAVPIDVTWDSTFVPGLEVMDRVDLSYRSYDLANNSLWDVMIWDQDRWGQEGMNFDFNSTPSYLTAIRANLDDLTTNFTARII